MSDISNALKFISNSRIQQDSLSSLLSMRAKLEYANGNFAAAMDYLDRTIRADLTKATEFANSGAVAPEKTASVCVWTQPDMDALVQRFPGDYRSYLLRGLYFDFFARFDAEWLKPAIENLGKAADMNPKSALPRVFKARILSNPLIFHGRLSKLGWSDSARDRLDYEVLSEYEKALSLDPDLLLALRGRALTYSHLKQFQKAIADYDRVLSSDPQDWIIYHDRGLAKMQLGRDYDAISDFSSAIKIKPREYDSYESRANAYMKTREWELAILDLTTAISLQVGSSILLVNIEQFRAIYPEYKTASNDSVARKLQQTFFPNWKQEDFSNGFFTRRAMPSTIIPDLYLKRSDAYLKKRDWHSASIDFRRAVNGYPTYAEAVERWREIGYANGARNYIDMKTFDDMRKDSVKFWLKEARTPDESTGPVTLTRFELNCGARRIRQLSLQRYDSSGALIGSRESGPWWSWQSIIPDTLGEMFLNSVCRSS
jgi:tetratricopeptide (TPR) repeat protein